MEKYLLGIRIDDIYEKGIEFWLSKFLKSKKFNMITPVNPIMMMISRKQPKFQRAINGSELTTCDGVGIVLMFKLRSRNLKRCAGSSLIYDVLDYSEKNHKKVFFLGAKPEVNKKVIQVVKEKYPYLVTSGYSPSYEKRNKEEFFDDEQKKIMSKIASFKPQIICIFLGAPFQEKWFYAHKKELSRLGVKIGLSLGRTADFVAGYAKRAPKFWQESHFEWLYRLFAEKGRFKKVFPKVPLFVLFSLKETLLHKVYKSSN